MTFREQFNVWAARVILAWIVCGGVLVCGVGIWQMLERGGWSVALPLAGIVALVLVLGFAAQSEAVADGIVATICGIGWVITYAVLIGIPLLVAMAIVVWAWRELFGAR